MGLLTLREIGCKMTWPVHIYPLSIANGTTIGLKIVKICPRPSHFSLRFLKSDRLLGKPINKHKETEPHDVYEVPVPSHRFESEMVIWREMSLDASDQNHRQHDRAQCHMKTVKTGEHEEC